MNHLICKLKSGKTEFRKVLSNKMIFEKPEDLDHPKNYDSDYNLDEDEWFHIPDFSKTSYCLDFLKKSFTSAEYDQIKKDDFTSIQYLCSIQSGIYYFQKLFSSHIITKKWFTISDAPEIQKNNSIILLNNVADAIYIKKEDRLYFKKLPAISSIFKGIDQLYREATQEETEEFLKQKFIGLEDGYDADKVKKANRKRIAMAMETFNKFNPKDKKNIIGYIKGYCKDLKFDNTNSQFKIGNEEELKLLLYGIEERYYTTPIGHEKRLANSVSKI